MEKYILLGNIFYHFIAGLRHKNQGSWGKWQHWSTCNVTCGTGIQIRFRDCDSPVDPQEGNDCGTQNNETRTCNADKCPSMINIIPFQILPSGRL